MSDSKQIDQSGEGKRDHPYCTKRLVGAVIGAVLIVLFARRMVDASVRNTGLLMLQYGIHVVDLESDWGEGRFDIENVTIVEKLLRYGVMLGDQNNTEWHGIGFINDMRGNEELALKSWDNIDDRRILYALGEYKESQEDWDMALQLYQNSLLYEDENPGLSIILYRIGFINLFLKSPADSDGALKAFQEAIAVDDFSTNTLQEANAHYFSGRILKDQHLFGDAIREYQVALDINEERFEIYSHYADALWELDRQEEAIELLKRVIDLDPNQKRAYRRLALFYQIEERYDEAMAILEILLDVDPDDVAAIQALEKLDASQSK